MKCPECNGRGETIYYVETDRDENTVAIEQRKGICRSCNGSGELPMTNADRIRAMTDEELAAFLDKCENKGYEDSSIALDGHGQMLPMLDWLQQPAEAAP